MARSSSINLKRFFLNKQILAVLCTSVLLLFSYVCFVNGFVEGSANEPEKERLVIKKIAKPVEKQLRAVIHADEKNESVKKQEYIINEDSSELTDAEKEEKREELQKNLMENYGEEKGSESDTEETLTDKENTQDSSKEEEISEEKEVFEGEENDSEEEEEDEEDEEEEEGEKVAESKEKYGMRLYYNRMQPSSQSVIDMLKLFSMDRLTQMVEIRQPENDKATPRLELPHDDEIYDGYNSIRSYLKKYKEDAGIDMTLYVLRGCWYCDKVLNFVYENGLQNYITIKRTRNINSDIGDHLRRLGGKAQYPALVANNSVMYESTDIIRLLEELFLNVNPSDVIPRVSPDDDDDYEADTGDVRYPKKYILFFFPGDKETTDILDWRRRSRYSSEVDLRPLNEMQYQIDLTKLTSNTAPELRSKIDPPFLVRSEGNKFIASSSHDMKVYLLAEDILKRMQKGDRSYWRDMTIYSSDGCQYCDTLAAKLTDLGVQNKVNTVKVNKSEDASKKFEDMEGKGFPSLAMDNVIHFAGADTIANFAQFILKMEKSMEKKSSKQG